MGLVLGIESSCDETAVALVAADRTIVAQRIASQDAEHAPYGGVVPEIAARAHAERLAPMIAAVLDETGVALPELSAIAATAGPGLIGGVMVGLVSAKALAMASGVPLMAINHLEGHALSPRLADPALAFPYALLLVSGGHCQILRVEGVGRYRRLATTIDDALGEAFDKTAKILGLGFPGGPAVERLAREGNARAVPLPRPLLGSAEPHFSFAGLKSAVLRAKERQGKATVPKSVRAEPVEAPVLSPPELDNGPSTGSGRTVDGIPSSPTTPQSTTPVRAELVEAPLFAPTECKDGPSTSSGRTDDGIAFTSPTPPSTSTTTRSASIAPLPTSTAPQSTTPTPVRAEPVEAPLLSPFEFTGGANEYSDADIAASFQAAAIDCVIDRLARALDAMAPVETLVVAGGVAANAAVRAALEGLAAQRGLRFSAPPPALCTDNAAMIAWAGQERLAVGAPADPLDVAARPRWPLDPDAEPVRGAGYKA